jgi:cobalt-zinc-cadmium efflux system membrane fusion protein
MRQVHFPLRIILPLFLLVNGLSALAAGADIPLTSPQIRELEIETSNAKPAYVEPVAFLPAVVVPPLGGRIAVAAPYAGTVIATTVLPGQFVQKGEPLATIASRDLIEAQSRVKQAEAELQAAEAVARRNRTLVNQHIGNPTRAEEAEAHVEKIRAMVSETKRLVGLSNIAVNSDASYSIMAPSAGRVVETRVVPGGSLEAMAAAVILDTTDELWIKAQVPAGLIAKIRPGDRVQVTDGPAGTVLSVGGSLDPITRSAILFAALQRSPKLVAGQMVTVAVQQPAENGSLEVPSTAVVWMNGRTVVFVKVSNGFAPREVQVRGRTADSATVQGNLKPDEKVAFTGLAQLEKLASGE